MAVLRPQGLVEAPAHGPSRAFDLVGDFLETLMKDPAGAEATMRALGESGAEALPAFLLSREEKLRLAEGKLRALFRPFASVLEGFLRGMGEGIAETLPAVLSALRGLIGLLRADSATHLLRELLRIARADLDVTPAAVERLFRDFVEGAVARLQAPVNGGDLSEEALARFELGFNLRNLEHLILEELEWPDLDPDVMVDSLTALYRSKGLEELLGKIALALDALDGLAGPLAKLLEAAMEVRISGGGSVGAAAAPHAECAGVTPSPAPMDFNRAIGESLSPFEFPSSRPICWYLSWMRRQTTYGDIAQIAERHKGLGFKRVAAPDMEKIAFHTVWAEDVLDFILHVISAEQGDVFSNLANFSWDFLDFMIVVAGKKRIPTWTHWVCRIGVTFLGGFEQTRFGANDAVYPLTMWLADWGEAALYKRWTWLLREGTLSFITLLNHDKDRWERWEREFYKPHRCEAIDRKENAEREIRGAATIADAPERARFIERQGKIKEAAEKDMRTLRVMLWTSNHNCYHGLCYFFGEAGATILPGILANTDRANYGFIGGGPTGAMIGKAFGGLAIAWPMTWLSLFLARIAAGQYPNDTAGMVLLPLRERYIEYPEGLGSNIGLRILFGHLFLVHEFVSQVMYLYLFTESHTGDGTFLSLPGFPAAAWPGYPANAAASPYFLPWGGTLQQCVQNNLGIWSHFPLNPGGDQTYAYDFNHDAGTEVLCMRAGIVSNICDQVPNNTQNTVTDAQGQNQSWNNVEILHLSVFPPGSGFGLAGVAAPAGFTYANGAPIEAGTLFPPYWLPAPAPAGTTLPLMPPTVPLHPSAAILPAGSAYAASFPGFAAGSTFGFLIAGFDQGIAGVVPGAGTTFVGGGAIPPAVVFPPATPMPPPAGTPFFPAGATFAPVAGAAGAFTPITCTYSQYGHGLQNFINVNAPAAPPAGQPNRTMVTVYAATAYDGLAVPPGGATAAQILYNNVLGRFMPQGQVVMLSGDTGVSAYNHLHVHVLLDSSVNPSATLAAPFVFADADHDMSHGFREAPQTTGVPRAMTFYNSRNTRIWP